MFHRALLLLSAHLAAASLPALAAGGASASPIVFNGLIVQDGKTKVSLYNPNTGDAQWVVVGKKFGNYTVEHFQPGVPGQTADTVILTLGTSRQRITLQGSADLSAASVATAAALKTSLAAALARARSAPHSEPMAIERLESMLSVAQSGVGDGYYSGRGTFFTAADGGQQTIIYINGESYRSPWPDVIINNVTGAATSVDSGNSHTNPDGSRTLTSYDAGLRVIAVSTYDASGRVLSVSTPPAPTSAAPATTPATAK
jgi:hypothetical protein